MEFDNGVNKQVSRKTQIPWSTTASSPGSPPSMPGEGRVRSLLGDGWRTRPRDRTGKEAGRHPLEYAPAENDRALRGRSLAPDVQLSSFQSWAEVGQWYWNLQSPRIEPSPAVRTKAAELTNGMTDDAAKLQALYTFVSLQCRYIGIAFGIGRYQPHAADDVLSNNYGDCKDKHTLLASLLQASGITLYPALINSARKLDPDVPSPGQFDHIIGYLPHGKTALWLDTTPEVGPLGYLLTPLRDKPALVMSGEKSAQLINTPADPPFTSSQAFKLEGKLRDDGSFEAHVQDTSRGDAEFMIHSAFRRIPQPQWRDLVSKSPTPSATPEPSAT